jgi:hypothetical protein
MTYRNGYRRTSAPRTGPRVNRFAAPCSRGCGTEVPAGQGILAGGPNSGWQVSHKAASWHGSPVSGRYINGCPGEADRLNLAGQWGAFAEPRCTDRTHAQQVRDTGGCDSCNREVRTPPAAPAGYAPVQADEGADLREVSRNAGSKYAYTASGARMTMSSRRCEDAPCCGCCD